MIDAGATEGRSVGEIAEAWCAGEINTSRAVELGDFDGFAELLEFAIRSDVPLRTDLTTAEEDQAAMFTELLASR